MIGSTSAKEAVSRTPPLAAGKFSTSESSLATPKKDVTFFCFKLLLFEDVVVVVVPVVFVLLDFNPTNAGDGGTTNLWDSGAGNARFFCFFTADSGSNSSESYSSSTIIAGPVAFLFGIALDGFSIFNVVCFIVFCFFFKAPSPKASVTFAFEVVFTVVVVVVAFVAVAVVVATAGRLFDRS